MTNEADIMRMWQRYYFTLPPFYRAPYSIEIHERHYIRWIDAEDERAHIMRPMLELVDPIDAAGLQL